jgi:phosphate transport system protein
MPFFRAELPTKIPHMMRDIFANELEAINGQLVEMGELVRTAMQHATESLLNADNALAEKTIANDLKIDEMQHELDARALMVMARQAPVASDLRALVATLRISSDFERMGDFAHHIARLARMYSPNKAIPASMEPSITEMAKIANGLVTKVIRVIDTRDTEVALQIDHDDDQMDKLQKNLMSQMTSAEWSEGTETAINMTLLIRYYERFADHAVSIARRVYFLVTGEFAPQEED